MVARLYIAIPVLDVEMMIAAVRRGCAVYSRGDRFGEGSSRFFFFFFFGAFEAFFGGLGTGKLSTVSNLTVLAAVNRVVGGHDVYGDWRPSVRSMCDTGARWFLPPRAGERSLCPYVGARWHQSYRLFSVSTSKSRRVYALPP